NIFMSIGTTYPLVQLDAKAATPKTQYLCIADTSKTSNENLISIHLCFQNKVNFKHKFLNHLFPDLKKSDYLSLLNGDPFNAEIKLLSKGKYIESSIYSAKKESSIYSPKKEKFASNKDYHVKQEEVADAAFRQESFASAVAIVKNNLKFEYLVRGKPIRDNIEYELQMKKKQKTMEYKPFYDSTTFNIPEEHAAIIDDWLTNDFRKRINNEIARSRSLFLTGPTKHGKTSWARSLGKHASFVIHFSLREWRDDVEYIILDDIHWKDIEPIAKGLLIAPGQADLTDKYMGKLRIDNNKPCIVCINNHEANIILTCAEADYWRENGVWVHLRQGQKMF
ncbi:unnamed protein product, partial [Adineta steineri]